MSKQIPFTEYEAVLLLDAYLKTLSGEKTRKESVRDCSARLRQMAINTGKEIDETFRNVNGISFQMASMESAFQGHTIIKPSTKLFTDTVFLYRNNIERYQLLLMEANSMANTTVKIKQSNEDAFIAWLSGQISGAQLSELYIALREIEQQAKKDKTIKISLYENLDVPSVKRIKANIESSKIFKYKHKRQWGRIASALNYMMQYAKATTNSPVNTPGNTQDINSVLPQSSLANDPINRFIEWLNDNKKSVYTVERLIAAFKAGSEYGKKFLGFDNNLWDISSALDFEKTSLIIEDSSFKEKHHPLLFPFKTACKHYVEWLNNNSPNTNVQNYSSDELKLYQQLYSVSRVYDDPSGLSVSRIISLIGKKADEKLIRDILDDASWATKLSEDVYSFSKKSTSALREEPERNKAEEKSVVTDSAFYSFLHDERGMADATCRCYVSAIRTAENYALSNGFAPFNIYNCECESALRVIRTLMDDRGFEELNARQHNRFSAAFTKFSEYVRQSGLPQGGQIPGQNAVKTDEPMDYDKEKFIQTLMSRYRNGMQFDSIDFDNFREMYESLFNERLSFDDAELEERLRFCGVLFKDRLFPSEGIIDKATKEKLFEYIDGSFLSGKKVLYYKAIFEDLASDFATCYTLSDEFMLRAYIEYESGKDKYYFFPDYMSTEKNISIDHSKEVEEYFLSAGKPMATDEVCKALSHIPKDQITRIITSDSRFIRNAKGEYFHAGIFEISKVELDQIAEIISSYIQQNEYAIWTDIWNEIQERMPVFLENNLYLSSLGIRNALAKRFNGMFIFESAVISMPEDCYSMSDIYQLYAKHHSEFTADDIYNLSKELDTVIYFDALAKVSVRVSHDIFIAKHKIYFDIDTIDKAIESFMSKDYIRIREIDSFLTFPNVGYEWNEYLLESFVYSYSSKFSLLSNGFSLNNVAGAIVKKKGAIQEFVDACAAVLAEAPISLNKKDALNYLAEVNMITRRSYRDLDVAISKANQIRVRKG